MSGVGCLLPVDTELSIHGYGGGGETLRSRVTAGESIGPERAAKSHG